MAIILFGGSFDPVHNGHLAMAKTALDFLSEATLLWIPAACSPFKTDRVMAEETHRLAMCRLIADESPRMAVSDIEFTMEKPSFTVRTVEKLQNAQPDDYYFLCGADAFLSLQRWKEYETLIHRVAFLAVNRMGALPDSLQFQKKEIEKNGGTVHLLSMPKVPVSSTEIRKRIQHGRSLAGLVPEKVERYIQENHLYKE